MWMMCYICEICVVEAGNINKNKKKALWTLCRELGSRQIFLFAESLVVGSRQTFVHPRCTEPLNMPLCREPSSRQICLFAESLVVDSRQTYFFFKTTSAAHLFFFTILCRRSLSAKKFFADGRSRQRSCHTVSGHLAITRARQFDES